MCCGGYIAFVPTVGTRPSESAREAAARQYHLRKKREAANEVLFKDDASETTTLGLGSTHDDKSIRVHSQKIENVSHLGKEVRSQGSIANRWRKFKAQHLSGQTRFAGHF